MGADGLLADVTSTRLRLPMSSAAYAISLHLLAAAIGSLATVGFSALWRRRRRRRRVRAFRDFFGTSGELLVVHSAVLDKPTGGSDISYPVYNYPATDIRATRHLSRLFESVGLQEGIDFNIVPDIRVKRDPTLWDKDLVLLCGPARNHVFRDISSALPDAIHD